MEGERKWRYAFWSFSNLYPSLSSLPPSLPPSLPTIPVKAAAACLPGLSFLAYSASDIYSMYVGEAEAAVRRAFALARQVGREGGGEEGKKGGREGVPFALFSGSGVYSMYVGEAEGAVRRAFALARQVRREGEREGGREEGQIAV